MGVGASLFFIALGAIIAFGVNIQSEWLDLDVVGWVTMLAGLAGLIITMWYWNRRRRVVKRGPIDHVIIPDPTTQNVAEVRED